MSVISRLLGWKFVIIQKRIRWAFGISNYPDLSKLCVDPPFKLQLRMTTTTQPGDDIEMLFRLLFTSHGIFDLLQIPTLRSNKRNLHLADARKRQNKNINHNCRLGFFYYSGNLLGCLAVTKPMTANTPRVSCRTFNNMFRWFCSKRSKMLHFVSNATSKKNREEPRLRCVLVNFTF